MKYLKLFILISLINVPNFSKSDGPSGNQSAENEVFYGLNDIYNLKFKEAETKFLNLQKKEPDNPEGYFYESLIYFYKALPTRDEAMYDKFIGKSEKVIELSENILDKNENDYDAIYYKGMSHSYTSLLMLSLNKNLLKAASNGNDGYRLLSALIEKNPSYYDAYMGLGLYKIAIGFVPEKYQFLLSLIGFEGNIREGMNLLKKSLENGHFTKTDSKVFLSIFSLREKEDGDKQSLIYARELTEEYPESPVFKVFYSGLLLQFGQPEKAIEISELALSQNNNSLQEEIIKSSDAAMGTAYFRLNNYTKAIQYLEDYMKYTNPEDRYNVYMFTLGVSYELAGNRSKAVDIYRKVRNNFIEERDGELDKFFYRYAQDKIKNPLREFDKKLILGMNLRESEKPDEAIAVYLQMTETLSKNTSDDDKIRLFYDMGTAYTYINDMKKAEECFTKCTELNPENEKWLVPHSYFELGKIYDRQGNRNKSGKMFEMIYAFDDFDFESFLDMRIANYKFK